MRAELWDEAVAEIIGELKRLRSQILDDDDLSVIVITARFRPHCGPLRTLQVNRLNEKDIEPPSRRAAEPAIESRGRGAVPA